MPLDEPTRREFLQAFAGATLLGAQGAGGRVWTDRLGLQVYTVRDRLGQDFERTLEAVGDLGYREVELFGSLGERPPRQVREILDRAGLSAVSTHIAVVPGPDLERELEAYEIIGHRFTAVRVPPVAGGRGRRAGNASDGWQRQAAALNAVGRAGEPYGIRALVHNHTEEFVPLDDGDGTGYDILLTQTDPALVAMELDIGWARIAGQDPVSLFRASPGRYSLWHVKDVTGLADPAGSTFVPVGEGEIDYREVFAGARIAGLEHFFIEQDNAPQSDSMDAIATSARNLRNILQ